MPDTTIATAALPSYWSSGGGGYAGGGNAYGTIPQVPTPVSTAPQATAGAISAGQAAYSQLPGYNASLGNVGANIQSETGGQLPADVIRQIQQQAAERGVMTGSPGSDNSNASYLQALGLNSLNLTNMGQQNLQSILPQLPGYGISQNPSFYPSAALTQDAAASNAIYRSAPDPKAAAEAAMRAAAAGVSAGRGSVPMPGGLNLGNPSGLNFAPPTGGPTTAFGTDVNTTGTLNTGAMSQSDVDRILAQYNPLSPVDTNWDTMTPYGDPNLPAEGTPVDFYGGTAASDTAPAGTSSGYYYAGPDTESDY